MRASVRPLVGTQSRGAAAGKDKRTVDAMTSFKPFNIRETDFDVWDDALQFKQEHIQKEYHHMGLLHQNTAQRTINAFGNLDENQDPNAAAPLMMMHEPSRNIALRHNEVMPKAQYDLE